MNERRHVQELDCGSRLDGGVGIGHAHGGGHTQRYAWAEHLARTKCLSCSWRQRAVLGDDQVRETFGDSIQQGVQPDGMPKHRCLSLLQ